MSTSEAPHTIGTAIRDARKASGVGLRELARRTNISAGQLSKIETGQVPSASRTAAEAIAAALSRPPQPLLVLAGDYHAQIIELPLGRRLIPDWTDEDEQRIESGDFAPDLIARLAYGLFVHCPLVEVLHAFGFSDSLADLQDAIGRAGADRVDTIIAFADEQGVLGELDRRGSNPAKRRLVGHLYDPADQARMEQILERVRDADAE